MDTLHHIAIRVTDIAKAVAWYHDRFDVVTTHADDSWALLRFENCALALVRPDQHPPHFAIERADAESFGLLVPHRDGTASVYIKDPWGNVVEILETKR